MQKIDVLTADQLEEDDVVIYDGDIVRVSTDPSDLGEYIYFWGWNYTSNDSEEFILFPDEEMDYYGKAGVE